MNAQFKIFDKVNIIGIGMIGVVRAVTCDIGGTSYKVSYWYEGAYRETWLPADELEPREK